MTEHKMHTIDGVRYRPEDVDQAALRQRRRSGPLSTRTAQTPPPQPEAPFDPSVDGVDAVLAYLGTADHAEAVRVLDAEAAGKARTTILSKREEMLAAKEDDDGDSSGASG